AFGGNWDSLESSLTIPSEISFDVLERAQDGATLLLAEGRTAKDAKVLTRLRWDPSAYRLYFMGANTSATKGPLPKIRGIARHPNGADIFVHEFRPEHLMLAFALHDGGDCLVGLLLGDDKSLAPIAPPPVGCPVLRTLISKYADNYGPRDLLNKPEVMAAIERSHETETKARGTTATRHAERSLDFLRLRVVELLKQLDGYSEEAARLEATPPGLKRGQKTWPELEMLQSRLEEAAYSLSKDRTQDSHTAEDLHRLDSLIGQVTNRTMGIPLFPGDLKPVRTWYEVAELGTLYVRIARAALRNIAWSCMPDLAAAMARLGACGDDHPTFAAYLEFITERS
ncbi:MAG: hypothetical protein U1E22_02085, partial [Coriobacteriia bacterium]|nr:hypothetical protein [Coriobacteriia bacterium]